MPLTEKIRLNTLSINNVTQAELLSIISEAILNNNKISIAYVNAHTFNTAYKDRSLTNIINSFEIVHPDGIGIYLASGFTGNKLKERFSGSDFYTDIIKSSIQHNWSFYFFGHDEETLNKIQNNYPNMNIKGTHGGYNFNTPNVVKEINKVCPDICIVGLSTPIQEKWINENKEKLNTKVIIAVGDGIKVFSGTKVRGPSIMRKTGFEWLARLLHNPLKYSRRYIVGNPLFLYRIIKIKFSKLALINLTI